MEKESDKYICNHSDEIVAYIYGEISENDRRIFESHLGACTNCTDEFAIVSDARFSVFEWRKEEFAPLPTPEISIPFHASSVRPIGVFAAVAAMIRNAGSMAQVSASLLLISGAVLIAIAVVNSNRTSEIVRGQSELPPTVASPIQSDASTLIASDLKAVERSSADRAVKETLRNGGATGRSYVRKIAVRSSKAQTSGTPSTLMGKAPVLNSFEEKEDRSLRLADLLDEAGG